MPSTIDTGIFKKVCNHSCRSALCHRHECGEQRTTIPQRYHRRMLQQRIICGILFCVPHFSSIQFYHSRHNYRRRYPRFTTLPHNGSFNPVYAEAEAGRKQRNRLFHSRQVQTTYNCWSANTRFRSDKLSESPAFYKYYDKCYLSQF